MAGDRATFLREAGLIEHGCALAFQVRGHADQRADRDHASATDTGDQDIPRLGEIAGERRLRQSGKIHFSQTLAFLQAAAVDRDKTRTEALDAGKILVAVALVDLALASVFGCLGQHRDAERFLAAVAAAFADQGVDEHAFLRILELATLAPAAFLGRAGLVVDQHADAFDLAQALGHGIEFVARDELDVAGKQFTLGPLLDLVAHHDDGVHALGAHLVGDIGHGQRAVDRLAAGHRDGVVVEDLVGDVDLGRDRLTDRKRTGMEIGAVAEILEYVFGLGEWRLAAPGRALAAHLGEGIGAPIHPGNHVVAADAAERARTFRHRGRGIVRTARAVVRGARKIRARQGEFLFLAFDPGDARADRLAAEETRQALGDHQRDHRRRQFARRRQHPIAFLVVLADHTRARRPVVHLLLHLRFEEGTLLLDHDDVFETGGEVVDADRFERPGHADLVYADADIRRGLSVDAQIFERLQHVEIALARGDDAEAWMRRIDHHAIDAIGARERARGLHRVLMQAQFLIERRVGPADIEAAQRHREIGRQHDIELMRIDVHRRRRFHRLGDRLEADPAPGVAAHRPAEHAHVQNILHAGGIEDRHHRADEFELRTMRKRRRTASVIVGRERKHAAIFRGARGIAMLEHIARTIHARSLAVPHREHTVVLRTGEKVGLLRAPDHGRAEVLVDTGLKFDP